MELNVNVYNFCIFGVDPGNFLNVDVYITGTCFISLLQNKCLFLVSNVSIAFCVYTAMLNVHLKYYFCYIFSNSYKLSFLLIVFIKQLKLGLNETFNQVFIIIWKVLQYPNVFIFIVYLHKDEIGW